MAGASVSATIARDVVVIAAIALGSALAVAAGLAAGDATAQGWFAAGYWRLVAVAAWDRFIHVLPFTAPAALVVIAALRLLRARGARLPDPSGRPALRAGAATLVILALLGAAARLDRRRTAAGPSLVLISIDTLRADRLGAYGYAPPTSPTLDARLARHGTLFEDVYSQSPKTTPSHMTLFTSLYPSVHGIELWTEGSETGNRLNPAVHTLAEVLKNAGFDTGAFTGGANLHRSRGFDDGFDAYKHSGQLARAQAWLEARRGHRFFLFFHTYAVHDPYLPAPEWQTAFVHGGAPRLLEAVARLRKDGGGWERAHRVFWESVTPSDAEDRRTLSALYDAAIRTMDERTLAPLLDRLDALGVADETLVVLTSDHGEAFGEHGVYLHDDLYAGTLRVPLVLRFPGRVPAGRRVPDRVRLIDVMPTVLELLGVPAPTGLQGRSLVPFLRDGTAGLPAAPAVSEYSNSSIGRVFESIRAGDTAYIVDKGSEQLFDLRRDPGEEQNLAASGPPTLSALRGELGRWREACRTLADRFGPSGPGVAVDAETAARLKALGYLGE
jgi:arylsulfatase A-like enzyme